MPTVRRSIETENADLERARQDDHLRQAVESGALDLAARRASLDAGHGLTGDEVLTRALKKRVGQRPPLQTR